MGGGLPLNLAHGAMGRFETGRQDVTKASRDPLTLAEQTARRLRLAGVQPDDPGLAFIRGWNAVAYAKAEADPERAAHIARARQWQLDREQEGQTDGP